MNRSSPPVRLPLLAAALLAAAALRAQQAPMLVVKTPNTAVVTRVAGAFDVGLQLPAPGAGQHYELTCAARGQCKVTTADGDVGFLTMRGDPAALATAFAEQIDMAKPIVQAGMMVGLQQQGFAAKEVGAFLKELWAFPQQLSSFALRIDGDPEHMDDGVTVTLDIQPMAGGYVSRIVDALEPGPGGAPRLPERGAMMVMRCSLAPASLQTVLGPFAEIGLRMTNQGEEALQQARALNDRWMKAYDGSFAMTFGEGMRGRMLVGVRDPAELDALMRSDDYRAMLANQRLPGQDVEYEITPDALDFRGCKWLRTKVSGAETSPFLPDGTFVSHVGRVGSYMAVAMGGDEGEAKALIDAVLDGKVARAPLADGAVVRVAVDVGALGAMGNQMAGMPAGNRSPFGKGVPEHVVMTLARRGHTLRWVTHLH
ncbi:MAG: hypothetical protein KDC48_06805 [Planctomycetes bacterium]|nr:hypothetical protein [Planctomycetota bacterium]